MANSNFFFFTCNTQNFIGNKTKEHENINLQQSIKNNKATKCILKPRQTVRKISKEILGMKGFMSSHKHEDVHIQ